MYQEVKETILNLRGGDFGSPNFKKQTVPLISTCKALKPNISYLASLYILLGVSMDYFIWNYQFLNIFIFVKIPKYEIPK